MLLALVGTACSSGKPKADKPSPGEAGDKALKVSGVLTAASLETVTGGNLTRDSAELTIVAMAGGKDVSEHVWVELHEVEDQSSTPVATGPGGQAIGLDPGTYRVKLRYTPATTAVGIGTVARVELPPGAQRRLRATVLFRTGVLKTRFKNGRGGVDAATEVSVRRGEEKEPVVVAAGGQPVTLAAGDYELECVWRADRTLKRTVHRNVTVEAGTESLVQVDFDVQLARARITVTDASTGADLTSSATVALFQKSGGKEERVSSGSAAFTYTLPAGGYRVAVAWAEPPFLKARGAKRVVLKAGKVVRELRIPIEVAAGTLSLRLLVDGQAAGADCTTGLKRQGRPANEAISAPWAATSRVPAGTWDATVTCRVGGKGELRRSVSGLVIKAGRTVSRTLRF